MVRLGLTQSRRFGSSRASGLRRELVGRSERWERREAAVVAHRLMYELTGLMLSTLTTPPFW